MVRGERWYECAFAWLAPQSLASRAALVGPAGRADGFVYSLYPGLARDRAGKLESPAKVAVEASDGIEPALPAWEAGVLAD